MRCYGCGQDANRETLMLHGMRCDDCRRHERRAQAHPRALPQVGLPWAPTPRPPAAEPLDLFTEEGGPNP